MRLVRALVVGVSIVVLTSCAQGSTPGGSSTSSRSMAELERVAASVKANLPKKPGIVSVEPSPEDNCVKVTVVQSADAETRNHWAGDDAVCVHIQGDVGD